MKKGRDTSLVYGVGVNDSNYIVKPTIDGKVVECKIYSIWKDLLKRCYDENFKEKFKTYLECSIDPTWHYFTAFRSWVLSQDYENKQLDKDLLIPGNKHYSKDTCCFISKELNVFITNRSVSKTGYTGVTKHGKKFLSRCRNPFTGVHMCLGTYSTPEEAHQAWKKQKHLLALEYSKLETNPQIIQALRSRYL